jgi:hypothetical protein
MQAWLSQEGTEIAATSMRGPVMAATEQTTAIAATPQASKAPDADDGGIVKVTRFA